MSQQTGRRGPNLSLVAGVGLGLVWVALALRALWTSIQGFRADRPDWALGYGLVGVLLLAAGLAAVIGTWWHLNRVSRPHRRV